MADIWIAIALMSLASTGVAWLAAWLLSPTKVELDKVEVDKGEAAEGSPQKSQAAMLVLALSILAMILFLQFFAGQLFWARVVPHSAAIIYTNLGSLLAALAAGAAWRMPQLTSWRRVLMTVGLGGVSLAAILWPLLSVWLRPPPPGQDKWHGPVAMQTSWATCSPAAAATLLRAERIPASEREMIPLCFTDYDGTPTLGLYRGVKLMALHNQRQVEIVDPSLEKLLAANDWPVLMAVRLPRGVEDPRFEKEWGWIPGMGHAVVALGRGPTGELLVADPAIGLEMWSEEKLRTLWQGNGLRVK